MKTELISIGDELLIGQTINTNVSWLGQQLSQRGADLVYSCVIRDDEADIIGALDSALERADLVIITGGLGPTKDDITKRVLTDYFDMQLAMNREVLERIESYFKGRGRKMLDSNIRQALLPDRAKILRNDMGTASGMWFEQNGKVVISLPGVPYEMKFILENSGFDMIAKRFETPTTYYRTVLTQGLGESFLAERIMDIESGLRAEGLKLAYLPSPGLVRLRISGNDTEEERAKADAYCRRIWEILPECAFGMDNQSLSEVVGNLLVASHATVGTVESCTGGGLASEIVSVSGSSRYFQGSLVTYSNELKERKAGVQHQTLLDFGAVSRETVEEMAVGGREQLGVDYVLATSGIAGPDGGTEEKPVGTVWIAVAGPEGVVSRCFTFGNNRERIIRQSILSALNMLRCMLKGINFEKS
jgi:nicotinamide-nucleotide amidase